MANALSALQRELGDIKLEKTEADGQVHLEVEMPTGVTYGAQGDTASEAAKTLKAHLEGNLELGETPGDPYVGMDEFERETAKAQDA